MPRALVWLAAVQGVYFALTGIWPLVHIRSFMAVTGPKRDLWLVRTVGVLVLVVSGVLLMAAWRHAVTPEVFALAVGCAAALGMVDVVYVARRVIDKIYLLDAAAEAVLIALWVWAWVNRQ